MYFYKRFQNIYDISALSIGNLLYEYKGGNLNDNERKNVTRIIIFRYG